MILSFLGDIPRIGESLRAMKLTPCGRCLPWDYISPTSAWIRRGVIDGRNTSGPQKDGMRAGSERVLAHVVRV